MKKLYPRNNIKITNYLFYDSVIKSLNLSNLNAKNVIDMSYMFL